MSARPIFLLSDFGLDDPFVGIMKAVIHRLAPKSPIFDLTHGIPAGEIIQGAVSLEDSFPWLPDDAVVCAVVDPGVGSARRAIAAQVEGRWLVAPDNGLLAPVLEARAHELYEIQSSEQIQPTRSATFHGRDVFAPAAALLANGTTDFLSPARDLQRLALPRAFSPKHDQVELRVIAVDHFGNLTLNLTMDEAQAAWPWIIDGEFIARCGTTQVHGLAKTFSAVEAGEPLVYWNSFRRLEVAINRGSAADRFGRNPVVHLIRRNP